MMLIQNSLAFAKEYPAILSLITFVVGLVVGNKQAIGRDKRKEFNEVSQDAFVALDKQLRALDAGSQGNSVGDLLLVESYFPICKRMLFRMRCKQYKNACQGVSEYDVQTSAVSVDPKKLKHLAKCTRKLKSYLRRR
jgi:hypothetical protein